MPRSNSAFVLWFCANMHGQIPCVHEPGPNSFLHVTLVSSRSVADLQSCWVATNAMITDELAK